MDAIKTMLNAIKVFVADRYLTKKEAEETYLKEIPETDLSDYATKTYVDEVLGVIENGSY